MKLAFVVVTAILLGAVSTASAQGVLVPLVTDHTPLPLSNKFGPPDGNAINQAGDLAIRGEGSKAVFLRRAGSLMVRVMQAGDEMPGFPGSRVNEILNVRLNASALLVFSVDFSLASGELQTAILSFNGTVLQKIVDGTNTAPGSGGSRYERPLSLIGLTDAGDILVASSLIPAQSGDPNRSSIFRIPAGGAAFRVAGFGDPAPGTATVFGVLTNLMTNNAGDVAFTAAGTGTTGGSGLFVTGSGGTVIRKVSNQGDAISPADGGGTMGSVSGTNYRFNNSGTVVFFNSQRLWTNTAAGGTVLRLSQSDAVPAPVGGTFGNPFTLTGFNDAGDISLAAAVVNSTNGSAFGLFRYRQSLGAFDIVAYSTQPAPSTGGAFQEFSAISMNASGLISFRATNTLNGQTLGFFQQSAANQPVNVVAEGGPTPFGGTYVLGIGGTQTLNNGALFFRADIVGGTASMALFLKGGSLATLMSTADTLPPGSRQLVRTQWIDASGDYIGFLAQRAGGPFSLGVHRISDHSSFILATDRDPAPSSGGGVVSLGSPSTVFVNSTGQIAFAVTVVGGSLPTRTGIYTASIGTGLAKVAIAGDVDDGGRNLNTLQLTGIISPINATGQVLLTALAFPDTVNRGLWIGSGGGVPAKIAMNGDVTSAGSTITSVSAGPAVNASGQATFRATTSAGAGIFVGSAGAIPTQIAVAGQAAPGGGFFQSFSRASINSSGEIVFKAGLTGIPGDPRAGLYKATTSPTVSVIAVAVDGTPAPSGGNYSMFGAQEDILINDQHDIVFLSDLTGGSADSGYFVLRASVGSLQTLALQGQPAPGTTGVFDTFAHTAGGAPGEFNQINAQGEIAFFGTYLLSGVAIRGTWHVKLDNSIEPILVRGSLSPEFGGGTAVSSSQKSAWVNGARYPIWAGISGGSFGEAMFLFMQPTPAATPAGAAVVVQPTDPTTGATPVTLEFANVVVPGTTTVTTSGGGAPIPGQFQLGDPPVYYNFTTTATFSGAISICVDFTGVTFPAGTTMKLLHYENGAWVDVTLGVPSGNQLCGTAASLSPFALVRALNVPVSEAVVNGDFGNALAGWSQFATPNNSYLAANVVGGVLEFFKQPAPPGESSSAVVFRETGVALASGDPIASQFDLGNSSSVRKRISVLILDSDFSDLSVCTFWIEPNSPLRTYAMRTHTTRAWTNASIYFYAASEGANGGAYLLDNVSMGPSPSLSAERTDCVDPTAPAATNGPDSTNLITNGDFVTGLGPWVTFGQIASQITNGVFEFRKLPGSPNGVVLQNTFAPVDSGQILTANFELGNSSAVRKRVTVLLHEGDFSDLTACTFWLAPGQALANYSIRAFTTKAWTHATLSVYPATDGPDEWTQLANVTLQRTPSIEINGTDCLEPGASTTPLHVIVDHADRLHERVADGRSDEGESASLQVLAHRVGLGGAGRNVLRPGGVVDDGAAADKLPDVGVEAAEFLLHGQKRACILHRRLDLEPVADDAGVGE